MLKYMQKNSSVGVRIITNDLEQVKSHDYNNEISNTAFGD